MFDQGGGAHPQGGELDAAGVEFAEHWLGGDLLVHDQHARVGAATAFQWSQNAMTSRFWVALEMSALA